MIDLPLANIYLNLNLNIYLNIYLNLNLNIYLNLNLILLFLPFVYHRKSDCN